jgi:hypothetical protein
VHAEIDAAEADADDECGAAEREHEAARQRVAAREDRVGDEAVEDEAEEIV